MYYMPRTECARCMIEVFLRPMKGYVTMRHKLFVRDVGVCLLGLFSLGGCPGGSERLHCREPGDATEQYFCVHKQSCGYLGAKALCSWAIESDVLHESTWYPARGTVVFPDTLELKAWAGNGSIDGSYAWGGVHSIEGVQVTGTFSTVGPLTLNFVYNSADGALFAASLATIN